MSEHQYTVPRNQGHFVLAKYDGKNRSGVTPIGKRVLVKMDEVPEVSAGGVALPGSYVERTSMASETGIIVEASPEAFTHFGDGMPWKGYRPVSGDRVYVEKYAGLLVTGNDGAKYRLMDDTCIGAKYDLPTVGETM